MASTDQSGRGVNPGAAPERADDADELEDVTSEEIALSPSELLTALARLDLEAAMGYEAAAEEVGDGDPELAPQLVAFAQDHRRHVDDLAAWFARQGEPPLGLSADPTTSLFAGLARLSAPLGPAAIVVALIGNEQLTNLSYEDALVYDWQDAELERMLERNLADEERHLAWLMAKHEHMNAEPDELPAPT